MTRKGKHGGSDGEEEGVDDALASSWDDLYEVDLKALRDMVGRAPRRFDQGPRKRRRLLSRALDVEELEGSLNPVVRECIPYIRGREKELHYAKEQVTRLVNKAQALKIEIAALRASEKNSLVVVGGELELATRSGEEELDVNEQATFSELLSLTKREVKKINKVVGMVDEKKTAMALDHLLRIPLGLSPNQQQDCDQDVDADKAWAVLQAHPDFVGAAEALRAAVPIEGSKVPYGSLLRILTKAKIMSTISRELPPTSESFRKREERRRLPHLLPVLQQGRGPELLSETSPHHRPRQASWPDVSAVNGLKTELQASGTAIKANRQQLQVDMEWVSTTLRTTHTRAKLLAIQLGLQRLVRISDAKTWNMGSRAFRKWDAFVQYEKNMSSVRLYLRYRSVQRALATVMIVRERRLMLGFKRLYSNLVVEREMERRSCIIEMQRVVRGFLGRRRWRRTKMEVAVVRIQCFFRGVMCRSRLRRRKAEMLERKEHAARLERHTNRAAKTIQRVVRGFIVRHRIKCFYEDIRRKKAAMRIQCLTRGVIARTRRAEIAWERKTRSAAIQIQKIGRAFLARKRVKRLREERAALLHLVSEQQMKLFRLQQEELLRLQSQLERLQVEQLEYESRRRSSASSRDSHRSRSSHDSRRRSSKRDSSDSASSSRRESSHKSKHRRHREDNMGTTEVGFVIPAPSNALVIPSPSPVADPFDDFITPMSDAPLSRTTPKTGGTSGSEKVQQAFFGTGTFNLDDLVKTGKLDGSTSRTPNASVDSKTGPRTPTEQLPTSNESGKTRPQISIPRTPTTVADLKTLRHTVDGSKEGLEKEGSGGIGGERARQQSLPVSLGAGGRTPSSRGGKDLDSSKGETSRTPRITRTPSSRSSLDGTPARVTRTPSSRSSLDAPPHVSRTPSSRLSLDGTPRVSRTPSSRLSLDANPVKGGGDTSGLRTPVSRTPSSRDKHQPKEQVQVFTLTSGAASMLMDKSDGTDRGHPSRKFANTALAVVVMKRHLRSYSRGRRYRYHRAREESMLKVVDNDMGRVSAEQEEYIKIGRAVVKLQSVGRMMWAWRSAEKLRLQKEQASEEVRTRAASIIQNKYRQHLALKAMNEMQELDEQVRASRVIQMVMRTFLAVRQLRKLRLEERRRSEMAETYEICAMIIQRYWRGHHVRSIMWYDIQYAKRRLGEMKMSQREHSALTIQCAYRVYKALQEYKRLNTERAIRRHKAEEERRIQLEIEAIHDRLTRESKITIIQCAVRLYLAARRIKKRRALQEKRDQMQFEESAWSACCLIQRWYRGHLGRVWFDLNYERLIYEREDRKYCIECTGKTRNLATRLCHTCQDRYCDSHWATFHAHGKKRNHTYKALGVTAEQYEINPLDYNEAYAMNNNNNNTSNKQRQERAEEREKEAVALVNKPQSDWVEYWDTSVQATYYYNLRTGEASWTTPEELEQGWGLRNTGGWGGGEVMATPYGYSDYSTYYN